MLYYVTRKDKNGNQLTTSYDTPEKAKKYGTGEDRKETKALIYFDPATESYPAKDNTGYIVRSRLVASEELKPNEGNFVIYDRGENDNEWAPTNHRYPTYGLANTAMKSLVGVYHDMLVVEEPEHKYTESVIPEDCPF